MEQYATVAIEIIGLLGGLLGLLRYVFNKMGLMQKDFLNHASSMQEQLLSHLEKKNGHNERIAHEFAEKTEVMAEALKDLAVKIEPLSLFLIKNNRKKK